MVIKSVRWASAAWSIAPTYTYTKIYVSIYILNESTHYSTYTSSNCISRNCQPTFIYSRRYTHTHTKSVCIPILSVIVGPRFKEDWETKCWHRKKAKVCVDRDGIRQQWRGNWGLSNINLSCVKGDTWWRWREGFLQFEFCAIFSEKTDFCIRSYMIIASTSYLALFSPSFDDSLFLFHYSINNNDIIYFLIIGL